MSFARFVFHYSIHQYFSLMPDKDKMFTDLHRLLNSKDFKSEEELQEFIDDLTGKKIPSQNKEELTDEEQAQDLVLEAWDLHPDAGKGKARKALDLDPDCIEAYEYLGSVERSVGKAIEYYKKGIKIGRKQFGGEFLEENKGHFWSIFETRPFMRCLQNYADCLYMKGDIEECVSVLEEIIDLNPNDNQGVRDQLGLYYLQLNRLEQFKKLNDAYSKDGGAFHNFNLALYTFKSAGRTSKADELLRIAISENEFVPPKLIQREPIEYVPDFLQLRKRKRSAVLCVVRQACMETYLWLTGLD